jgi:CRP-like cAMP-binding protein
MKKSAVGGWSESIDHVWLSVLGDVPLFRGLSKHHLHRVARLMELRRYPDGAIVVRKGVRGDAFYVIFDGRARAVVPGGKTKTLEPGTSFGELALIDGAPRAATVGALGELTTARIPRTPFLKLLREEPKIAAGLIPGLAAIVREAQREDTRKVQDAARLSGGRAQALAAGQEDAGAVKGGSALGWNSLLSEIPLFESLSARHLGHIRSVVELKRARKGSAIVRAGARGDAFYVILDGSARAETPAGQTKVLDPGEFFGELALLDGAPRSATVTAVDDVTMARIARADFRKLMAEEPTIALGLAKGLVAIIRALQ